MAEDNATAPQVHFRAVLPPDFTGDGNESFSQWARRFQVCCETPDAIKVPGWCERARSTATEPFSLPAPAAPQPATIHSLTTESANMLAAQLSDLHLKPIVRDYLHLAEPKTINICKPLNINISLHLMNPTSEDDHLYAPVRTITDHKGVLGQVIIRSKVMTDPDPMTVEMFTLALKGNMLPLMTLSSQSRYRHESEDYSSPEGNRDRRRGKQYYRHRSPSPQRPHSHQVHFTEHQQTGNEW
ncbi:hypothetical protein QQF64_012043 [Cirrhinus molitorella]|uniref:Uncharacterized protein n=1 Tax=Cirrhinus molitorella TaxID=172907 RepID=A0ABR3LUH9_9TELE